MDHPDLPIIVLAAGASKRMRGRDKLAEHVAGDPLLRRQAKCARAATSGPVLIALPPPPHPRYALLSDLDVTPVPVPDAQEGMGASLRTAVAALPADADHAMVLLADLPELTTSDLIQVAYATLHGSDTLIWRGATEDGVPGHPIVFDKSLFPALTQLSGDSGGREVVAAAKGRVCIVPLSGERATLDLDTPEDWATWMARTAQNK